MAFATLRAWETYDHAPFAGLPAGSWSAELFLLAELVEALTDRACLSILAELGIPVPGHLELMADDLRLGCGIPDERALAFHWLWKRLAWSGYVTGEAGGEIVDVLPVAWDDATIDAAVIEHRAKLGTTPELIEHVRASWAGWLQGKVDGKQVLFSRRSLELWAGYFQNENRPIGALNALGAAAAARALEGRTGLRALEVGGGLGSGAASLLGALGPRLAAFELTELVPQLLAKGEPAARAAAPAGVALSARTLDLDRPLAEQGVEPASKDLVFGVNTLHAVKDLVASLAGLHAALAPGGALVLAECVRPTPAAALAPELIFQLSPQFQQVAPEPGVRDPGQGGFLEPDAWRTALGRAGFARVDLWPDPVAANRAYPRFAMAAIVAHRD